VEFLVGPEILFDIFLGASRMTCLVAGGSETWEDISYGQWSWSPGRILAGFMHFGYARLCNELVPYRPGWEGVQHTHQLKREQVSKFHAYHVSYLNLDGVRA